MTGRRQRGALALVVTLAASLPGGCFQEDLQPLRSLDAGAETSRDAGAEGTAPDLDQPRTCARSEDCPAGTTCELSADGCVPRRCGLPAAGTGTSGQGQSCLAGQCGAGLVCVSTALAVSNGALKLTNLGTCRPACDPCAPSCPALASCIQLPTSGGFCAPSGMAQQGEFCAGRGCPEKMSCEVTCQRACLPLGPMAQDSASASDDCLAGEVCQIGLGNRALCQKGQLVGAGFVCDPSSGVYCQAPARCDFTLSFLQSKEAYSLCTPADCNPPSCPPKTTCSSVLANGAPAPRDICIGDKTLPFNVTCGDDANCAAGLRCLPTSVPNIKACLIPGG